MVRVHWTKETVEPTAYTKETINPTHWNPGEPFNGGALELSTGGLLELSTGQFLGITE